MKTTTTLALAGLTLALGTFIFFYERHTVGTSEITQRRGRVLEVFDRARVDRIELAHGDRQIVLVRKESGDPDEEARFHLESPVQTHADEEAVEALLGALDWAVPFRSIEGVDGDDRARFGFDEPFASVALRMGGRSVHLVLGAEAPEGEGRYARGDDEERAFVLSADVIEALLHDVDHFRGKALFPESFASVTRIEREGEGGDVTLVEGDGALRIEAPQPMSANSSRVEAFTRGLETLAATHFLDAAEVDVSQPPRLRIRFTAGGETHELQVFGGCPGADGKALARADGGAPLCIDEASLDPLTIDRAELRDLRLASARDFDVERLELSLGARRLVVDLGDDPRFEIFEGGDRVAEGEADEAAFTDWLRAMRRTVAREAAPLEGSRSAARHGLEPPKGELRIVERGPLKRTTVLHIGDATVTSLYARRAGEDVLLEMPEEALDLLTPVAHRLRSRTLLDAELHQVVAIRVSEGGAAEGRAVDPTLHTELAARLAALEAVRFDADRAEPRHALSQPRLTVEFELAPEDDHGHSHGSEEGGHTRHVLALGAATEGGVYARLGEDPAVFVVADALFDAAAQR